MAVNRTSKILLVRCGICIVMTTELAFVFGKACVCPMKALTIPKIELQAALLAARLKDEVQKALTLTVERTLMWTDSTTVLHGSTRGLSEKALSESSWLKSPAFSRTSDWPFQPLDEISKSKLKKLGPTKYLPRSNTKRRQRIPQM